MDPSTKDLLDTPGSFKGRPGWKPIIEEPVVKCACEKKNIPVSQIKRLSTWYTELLKKYGRRTSAEITDRMCAECSRDSRDFCRVVCTNCREVVLRFPPYKDRKTGFTYKPGQYYHMDTCPKCAPPGTEKAAIIEFEIYKNNILKQ